MIALMNLLNRLSESLKSVTDMGSSAAMNGLFLESPAKEFNLIQRLQESWMSHW